LIKAGRVEWREIRLDWFSHSLNGWYNLSQLILGD
jgi:hypothetical protein